MATRNLGWAVTCDDCNTPAELDPYPPTSSEALAAVVENGWTSRRERIGATWRRVDRCPACTGKQTVQPSVWRNESADLSVCTRCDFRATSGAAVTAHTEDACAMRRKGAVIPEEMELARARLALDEANAVSGYAGIDRSVAQPLDWSKAGAPLTKAEAERALRAICAAPTLQPILLPPDAPPSLIAACEGRVDDALRLRAEERAAPASTTSKPVVMFTGTGVRCGRCRHEESTLEDLYTKHTEAECEAALARGVR